MKFYIGNGGAKNPGLVALIRLVIWNIVENDHLNVSTDYVKDVDSDGEGIYIELDPKGKFEPAIPEHLLPTVLKQLTKKLAKEIPSCIDGIMKNAQSEGEDPKSYLESIVNGGDEESGLFPVDNANYELGDEKLAAELLEKAMGMDLAESLDILLRSGVRVVKTKS